MKKEVQQRSAGSIGRERQRAGILGRKTGIFCKIMKKFVIGGGLLRILLYILQRNQIFIDRTSSELVVALVNFVGS